MTGFNRRSTVHSLGRMLVALSTLCGVSPLRAEDAPVGPGSEPPVAYRRIFVPVGDTAVWPRDGEKYLPVEARDFEAWVTAANRVASAAPPAATITEAAYSARLENGQLVAGRGEWTIASRGGEPAIVALGPMSLVVREAHWNDDSAAPVRLGAWGRSGELPSGMGVEVVRAGTVAFQWRAPSRVAAGDVELAWRLPPAATTRLMLDLPVGKRPIWEGSLILRSAELASKTGAEDGPARALKEVRWEMIAGPEAQPTLRIVDAQAGPPVAARAPTLVLREEVSYNITPRGLDIEAQLRLEDSSTSNRQLSIRLPAGVQLVSATVDGRELSWRLASGGRMAPARALLDLPALADGVATTVALRAWQVPVMDTAWQLPTLRPDDVFWAAGSVHISLSPLVELRSMETSDCVQTSVQLAGDDGDNPETISLAEYSPAASVAVLIGQRAPVAEARVGTTLVVGNADVTGRSVTRFDVAHGALHTLRGELPPGWNVDAVETTPSDALGEWYVDERDGQRIVELQLAEAVRPDRPVTLSLTGRLQPTSLSGSLSAETLRMVRWRDAELAQSLLLVQTAEPYVVETVGELPVVAAADLTEEDRSLVPAAAEGPIYDMRGVADAAAVRLSTKKGRYTAEIWLDAVFTGNELRQTYHMVSRPQGGRVDQILVYVTAKTDGEVRWAEKSSGRPITAERVPADDSRRAGLPADGELWHVHVPRAQSRSVEIVATLTTPWLSRGSIPLLSLPEATDQRGRVRLSVDAEHAPQLEVQGLCPIPLPTDSMSASRHEGGSRTWAAYRYEPAQCQDAARRPQLWLDPTASGAAGRLVIARRVELESQYAASGEAAHRATYHLENERAASMQLRLPEGAQLTSAKTNGRNLGLPAAQSAGQSLTIPLPAGGAVILSLSFTTKQPRLAPGSRLLPPVIESEMSILSGEWTVWLPTEFVALGMGADETDGGENWRQRLFGPLGRPAGARLFDPLQGGTWPGREDASAVADVQQLVERTAPPLEAVSAPGGGPAFEHSGWRAYRRMFVAGVPAPIVIAQPPATTAWSIAVFLLCLVGGGFARRRREWFIGLTATAAVLCLMLPAVYAPLATGAFLGFLASLLVVWPRRSDPAEAPTRTWNRLATAGATATALVILLVNLATAQHTSDADAGRSTEPASIERVLMPVDAERRPAGSKIYVNEQFLRQLVRRSAESSSAGGQWLLTNAAYRGELRHGPKGEEAVIGEWNMAFDVEVLGRDTTIRLPLVRDEADWPTTVELDGIPLPLVWHTDGRSCAVDVAEPGRYELTISFVPRVIDVAGRNQIALTIPQRWGAAFELRRPADMSGLEAVGANWQSSDDSTTGAMRGELDDTGRFVLRWPRTETPSGPKDARLTELRWLWIGAAGAEMDVKYIAPRGAQLPQSLTISADRHWEMVNDENEAKDIRVTEAAGHRNTVQVFLRADDRERGDVTLRWRLTDPPTLGRLSVPPMELAAAQVSSSWLAVSSDPVLECEVVDAAGLPAETGEEFLTLWQAEEGTEPPQIVLGSVAPASRLSVGMRPQSVESAIDEELHVAAGADAVRVQYQADVAPGRLHRFQFPLTVPAEMTVDKIGVTLASRPIAVRWSRPTADRVNVFFGEELAEPYRLTIAGHVRVTDANGCALPRVVSATQNAVVERVQVYRDEAVLVEVQGQANADDAAADLPPVGWNARLVAAYQLDSSATDQVRLAIKPNSVETVGETLTTLSHEEALWWATWSARLVVRQGELDTLQLRVPANWVGPFEVQPAGANVAVAVTPDGRYAVLSVRLPESIDVDEAFELEIRGPFLPGSGAPVTVPEIVSAMPVEWRSYLSVPANVQSQEVAWTREGVEPAEPPGNLQPSRTPSTPAISFRVTASPYHVALAPQQVTQPTASVRMADTVVFRGPAGNQLIATRFVLVPQGLTDCELQLPDGQQLVCVKLDGQPARIRLRDEQRWAVSLGAPQLPQILDVVSRDAGPAAQGGRRVELQRPALLASGGPLPVEMSLWSFGQGQITGQPRVDGAAIVDAVDQAGLRLDRLAGIAEAATPVAIGLPIPDGYDWFRAWAESLTDAQEAARATIATSVRQGAASQVTHSGGDPLAPAADRISNWIERGYDVLGWPDLGAPLDSPAGVRGAHHWPPAVEGIGGWIYCVADGSADRMTVELSRADADSGSTRIFGALAIAGLAAASVWLVRQPGARDPFCRWPHAIGVLAGVCWWAWLWPSWLGLFLAAASLLLSFRSGWPGHSLRAEGSTVLRVPRPR